MWKDRLWNVVLVTRTVFKWTWIPLILYLGITQGSSDAGMPEPTLFNAVWVL